MTELILPRRGFLKCLAGVIAAPAVIKASALMKMAMPRPDPQYLLSQMSQMLTQENDYIGRIVKAYEDALIYGISAIDTGFDVRLAHIPLFAESVSLYPASWAYD